MNTNRHNKLCFWDFTLSVVHISSYLSGDTNWFPSASFKLHWPWTPPPSSAFLVSIFNCMLIKLFPLNGVQLRLNRNYTTEEYLNERVQLVTSKSIFIFFQLHSLFNMWSEVFIRMFEWHTANILVNREKAS